MLKNRSFCISLLEIEVALKFCDKKETNSHFKISVYNYITLAECLPKYNFYNSFHVWFLDGNQWLN